VLPFGRLDAALLPALLALAGAAATRGTRGVITATGAVFGTIALATIAGAVLKPALVPPLADLAMRAALLLAAATASIVFWHSAETGRSHVRTVIPAIEAPYVSLGLTHTVATVCDALTARFDARRVDVIARETATGRVFVWQRNRPTGAAAEPLQARRLAAHLFDQSDVLPHADAWTARRVQGGVDIVTLDAAGSSATSVLQELPGAFLSQTGPFERLLAFAVRGGRDWEARVFVLDGSTERDGVAALTAGRQLVHRLAPAADGAYLLHRIRTRSAANERMRIGRELHDGIIQSVMGVQIQLHALGARMSARSHALAPELARLAAVLRDEALALRELMQQMQPLELDPDRLIDTIAAGVKRFQHETGITARFITDLDRLPLPPRACRELARVVQEALVNVRKHSGAAHVFVRLTRDGDICRLSIDDDGCGFPFSGQLFQHDHAYDRVGPRVIRERVRLIGGEIDVESAPASGQGPSGARINVRIPLVDTYAVAG